ncbi:MAG: HEPN domain-containing protein [Deltaproteobacteria bacterium]|nr:HEPN domain-containing protein [Deltaproteobacteria bacterium]
MTRRGEWQPWLRDAELSLADARRNLRDGAWRVVCITGQLAVEMAAKAVIAAFAEPRWTHDPGEQLRSVLLARSDTELDAAFGPSSRAALEQLAQEASEAALWHGRATYGQRTEDGSRLAAAEVCTEEAARELLGRAERAVGAAVRLRLP